MLMAINGARAVVDKKGACLLPSCRCQRRRGRLVGNASRVAGPLEALGRPLRQRSEVTARSVMARSRRKHGENLIALGRHRQRPCAFSTGDNSITGARRAMGSHEIAVIRGDGIGTEVIEEGLKVLYAAERRFGMRLRFTEFPWGTDYYFQHGTMMPAEGLDMLKNYQAIFFGAVGHPDVQDHITLNGLLLPMRRGFDQYVCQRPSVLYPGVMSPLRGYEPGDIDMMVIRENTEGEYAYVGGFQYQGFPEEVAIQASVFTRRGIERVVRYSFELARQRNKKRKVASITKSNAQGYGMVLWDRVFQEVAAEYPDIATESLLVDAACMNFVRRPASFDVVVGSNLFGDILTDLGAIITGSMGLAPSGNINPEKRFPSTFEPVHGSAPDIAGKGIANPIATVLSAAMMLRHLGETQAAEAIDAACMTVLRDGEVVPQDLGGRASTAQIGDAIVHALEARD